MPKVSLLYKWFAPQMQDSLGPDNRTIANRTIRKTLLRYGLLNFGVNFVMLVSGLSLAAGDLANSRQHLMDANDLLEETNKM